MVPKKKAAPDWLPDGEPRLALKWWFPRLVPKWGTTDWHPDGGPQRYTNSEPIWGTPPGSQYASPFLEPIWDTPSGSNSLVTQSWSQHVLTHLGANWGSQVREEIWASPSGRQPGFAPRWGNPDWIKDGSKIGSNRAPRWGTQDWLSNKEPQIGSQMSVPQIVSVMGVP